MRIALYVRKSTEQEDRQVQSLDDQVRELTALAMNEGLQIKEIFTESRSAKVPNTRPEFERLIGQVEAGNLDAILTWSINRLSRNPVDGGRVAYLLQTGRLSAIKTIERTYRPEDNALLLSIENGMATAYLQDLSRNTKRGMRGKVERGWHIGKAPVGYKNDAETKEIVEDPERFELMRLAWDLLLSGTYSVAAIHRLLVERKLTVYVRRGTPQVLSRTGLYQLFKNRFYTGEIPYRGEWLPGNHTPMVTHDEFQRAQEIVGRGTVRRRTHSFAYAGVFRCATCGCAVVGERRFKTYRGTGRSVSYIYYHCSGAKGCSKRAVREEELTALFAALAAKVAFPSCLTETLESSLMHALERKGVLIATTAANVTVEVKRQSDRLSQLALMRADGELSTDEFSIARDRVLDALNELQSVRTRHRTLPARVQSACHRIIQTAVDAGELQGGAADPFALGHFARACGSHLLNLTEPVIKLDPVLSKIAAFEPLKNGSQTFKLGDISNANPIWLGFVDEMLDLLLVADTQQTATTEHDVQSRGVS